MNDEDRRMYAKIFEHTRGDWCVYWFIFWYGVGTEILCQTENQLADRLLALGEARDRLENFCSTFEVGKPGWYPKKLNH